MCYIITAYDSIPEYMITVFPLKRACVTDRERGSAHSFRGEFVACIPSEGALPDTRRQTPRLMEEARRIISRYGGQSVKPNMVIITLPDNITSSRHSEGNHKSPQSADLRSHVTSGVKEAEKTFKPLIGFPIQKRVKAIGGYFT